jgi:hypothetical protein
MTLPVGTAVVRKIRSPQITGVEKPRPGIAIFHLIFFVSLNSTGAAVRAMPLKKGPRHCGQCAGSEPAEPRVRTTVVSAIRDIRPPMADNLFVISSSSGESVRRTDGFAKAFVIGSYVAFTEPRT